MNDPCTQIVLNSSATFCQFANAKGLFEKDHLTIWVNGLAESVQLIDLYQLHKEEFLHYIDANSSFVLYDANTNYLVAVRDFFGAYPLYYTEENGHLYVGFSVKSIVESGLIPIIINPTAIKSFLSWESNTELITSQTVYQDLYSVLPGHALLWQSGSLSMKPYCKLADKPYESLADEEYVRQFQQRLADSVLESICPFQTVATHLSGGLDSTSISSVAQSLSNNPVQSFFIKTDTPTTREESYAEALLTKWEKAGKPIVHKSILPDDDVYAATLIYTQMTALPCRLLLPASTFMPILEQAQQSGCQILLSGHGGDQITGYGFEYMDVLFGQQNWSALRIAMNQYADCRELRSLAGGRLFKNKEVKRKAYTLHYFAQKIRREKNWITRSRLMGVLVRHFRITVLDVVRSVRTKLTRRKQKAIPVLTNWLRTEWLNNQVTDRATQKLNSLVFASGSLSAIQKQQLNFMFGSLGIHYNEDMAQLQEHYSLKTAHPFLNKKLLELALFTPLKLRFADGLGRGVLRKAMAHYLPTEVAGRVDKGEFSVYSQQVFKVLYTSFREKGGEQHPVWDIVDKQTFDRAVQLIFDETYMVAQKNVLRFTASRVIYLAIWLDYLKAM